MNNSDSGLFVKIGAAIILIAIALVCGAIAYLLFRYAPVVAYAFTGAFLASMIIRRGR